jgi:hypothetical protein
MNLKQLIKESLINHNIIKDCGCGCKGTAKCFDAPLINENLQSRIIMTDNMKYHINAKKPLFETTLPYGSKEYLDLWAEARYLYSRNALNVSGIDKEKITETHLGEYGIFEGQIVPLDMPMLEEVLLTEDNIAELEKIKKEVEALMPSLSWIDDVTVSNYSGDLDIELDYELDPQEIKQLSQLASKYNMDLIYKTGKNATLTKRRVPPKYEELNEAKYQGRTVTLNKPSQGDSKKFKVYVKNAKGKVVKVNFGFGGKSAKGKRMVIKDKNPKARAAYRARHNCKNPGPKWKANYWSCKAW